MTKEHCKTCTSYEKWTETRGYCEWLGEDIHDPENLTCFEWEIKEEEEDD